MLSRRELLKSLAALPLVGSLIKAKEEIVLDELSGEVDVSLMDFKLDHLTQLRNEGFIFFD